MATVRTDDKGTTWVNVNYTELQGKSKTAFEAMKQARVNFIATLEAEARKARTLGNDESLKLNFKSYGFGMTKATGKTNSSADVTMFQALG